MTTDEFTRLLRHLAKQQPFMPYQIVFYSSNTILVRHPETVTNASATLFVHQGPDNERRIFPAASVSEVILPPSKTIVPPPSE